MQSLLPDTRHSGAQPSPFWRLLVLYLIGDARAEIALNMLGFLISLSYPTDNGVMQDTGSAAFPFTGLRPRNRAFFYTPR